MPNIKIKKKNKDASYYNYGKAFKDHIDYCKNIHPISEKVKENVLM